MFSVHSKLKSPFTFNLILLGSYRKRPQKILKKILLLNLLNVQIFLTILFLTFIAVLEMIGSVAKTKGTECQSKPKT